LPKEAPVRISYRPRCSNVKRSRFSVATATASVSSPPTSHVCADRPDASETASVHQS